MQVKYTFLAKSYDHVTQYYTKSEPQLMINIMMETRFCSKQMCILSYKMC